MNKSEVFTIDGMSVVLTRVPIRRYDWGHGENGLGHPKEQALYEIAIDGENVGYASRPHGWGKQSFSIERLGDDYIGGYGGTTVFGQGYISEERRIYKLEDVARKAAELRKATYWGASTKLPTLTELKIHIADYQALKNREAEETEQRRQQWARERHEREAKAEETRLDILGGLKSLDDRLSAQLSNYEANAVRAAIAHYAIKPR